MRKIIWTLALLRLSTASLFGAIPESFADTAYRKGMDYYQQGLDQESVNWLYRFLSWTQRSEQWKADGRVENALETYEMALAYVEARDPVEKPVAFETLRKPARRRSFKRPRKSTQPEAPSENIESLLQRGRQARERGQLEYALRLYKLAGKMNAESPEIKANVAELEKEIR